MLTHLERFSCIMCSSFARCLHTCSRAHPAEASNSHTLCSCSTCTSSHQASTFKTGTVTTVRLSKSADLHGVGVALQDAENNWQFDIFGFAEATPGHTLSLLTFHLLQTSGQIQDRNYDPTRLARYIRKVEAGYNASNPYHNRYVPKP